MIGRLDIPLCSLVAGIALAFGAASAQEVAGRAADGADQVPVCLTLGQAIEAALDEHPRVDIAAAEREIARAEALAAYSQNRPSIGLFGQAGLGSTQPLEGVRDDQAGVRGNWDLYTFGRRAAAQRAARAQLRAARAGEGDAKREVARAVALSYLDALNAEALLQVAREQAESYAQDAALADSRLERRVITLADASRIKTRHAVALSEVASAEARLDVALARLEVLAQLSASCLDENSAGNFLTAGAAEFLLLPIPAALERASERSFALEQAGFEVEAAQARLKEARRANLPTVSADAFTLYRYDDFRDTSEEDSRVGLSVRIDLYGGGQARAERAAARARLRGAQAEERLAKLAIEDEVRRALAEARSAQRVNDSLTEASGHAAVELRALKRAYERRAATLTDLVLAVESFYGVSARQIDGRFAYYRALVELYAALGEVADRAELF